MIKTIGFVILGLSGTAFARSTVPPLKCKLVKVDNTDTSKYKILDSAVAEYENDGMGGISADIRLESGPLLIDIFAGKEGKNSTEFSKSISISDGGVFKVASHARERAIPSYFSMDYRSGLDHRCYLEMYLVACSTSGKLE